MDDTQLLRYHRQILLPQINTEGQEKLAHSKVLIVGMGGLGSPVAMYLAAAGLGRLILADPETVELSNLQRQVIHDTYQLGQPKVTSALDKLYAINPDVNITALNYRLEGSLLETQIRAVHAVVDCSDHFTTRFAINAACVRTGVPLISGATIRYRGQIATFLPNQPNSPCYHCLYHEMEEPSETCSETGILAPLVGLVGSFQAVETIKVLLHIGETLCGRLLLIDGYTMRWRTAKLLKDPHCPVCSIKNYERK